MVNLLLVLGKVWSFLAFRAFRWLYLFWVALWFWYYLLWAALLFWFSPQRPKYTFQPTLRGRHWVLLERTPKSSENEE